MARRRSDIQPRLIEVARAQFLRVGVDGASLRAIAAGARTNIGMIYYYFPTKDDLFFAVVEETYARVLEDLVAACAPDVPPLQRIERLYARLEKMTAHEGEVIRLVIREVLASSKRLERLFARFQRGHIPIVLATITDAMRDGTLRDDIPPPLAGVITFAVGAFTPVAMRQLGVAIPPPAQLFALLRDGLGTQRARPRTARKTRSSRARR
jgi:AcrR family transcriptional regulator